MTTTTVGKHDTIIYNTMLVVPRRRSTVQLEFDGGGDTVTANSRTVLRATLPLAPAQQFE